MGAVVPLITAGAGLVSTFMGMRKAKTEIPKAPEVPKMPSPEEAEKTALAKAKEEQRRRRIGAVGYRETILTSPEGAPGAAPVRRKTLLGD